MRLTVSIGRQEIVSEFNETDAVTVEKVLVSLENSHPEVYVRLCNKDGRLRDSMPVFINGNHIRYLEGMASALKDGDNIYIIPLITGG